MVIDPRTSEDEVPTIPPVIAASHDETTSGRRLASSARQAAGQVLDEVRAVVDALLELVFSAARGGTPSSPRAGLRSPAPVPIPVPVRLHTARRQARLSGHPAGHCCRW